MKSLSRVRLFATPWTVAYQAPLSMGFSRQEYWSGFLLQGIFLTQGSNWGLLHCRQILDQLSYQGSPTSLPEQLGSLCVLVAQSCLTVQLHGLYRLLHPWDSPGEHTGVGCHDFLQGTFPTQGSNPGLLHCRRILDQLSYQGGPRRVKRKGIRLKYPQALPCN